MGTIENTLGIVGRGRAVDNLIRAIAEGAIPLEGVDRIVFYNPSKEHTDYKPKSDNNDFLQKVHNKRPCGEKGPTLEEVLKNKKISVNNDSVYNDFTDFYRKSSALFFAPGLNLFEKQFQDITDAIIDDFISAEKKIKGTDKYSEYKRTGNETYKQMLSRLKKYDILYEIMVDVSKLCTIEQQQDFFIKAYEHGHFKRIEDANHGEKELEKKITVETLKIIFEMKREGRLPYGYRIWGCFAPSLKMLIDYAKLFRLTLHEPKNDPKPILVLTNEMSMVCNILAMLNPRLTPFLVGVSDYDVERARELFADYLKSEYKEDINIGVIGDHESYALPIFPKGFLKKYNINSEDAHTLFRNKLYSYVSDKSQNHGDPNATVRDSLIKVINAAIKSLETGLRFEGDFYDGIFIPFDSKHLALLKKKVGGSGYVTFAQENEKAKNELEFNIKEHSGIFATYHHSFCNGKLVPLTCEVSDSYVEGQFVKCLEDYTILLYRLITNKVIGELFVDPITKERIWNLPYVENVTKDRTQDKDQMRETKEYLVSLQRRVVWLENVKNQQLRLKSMKHENGE